jgi:23S rRNA pseudouridine955/2504/2580 synthase
MTIKTTIAEDRIKLNAWMKARYPALTMSHLQKLCRTGQIRADGKRATPSTPLLKGIELKLPPFIGEYAAAGAEVKKAAVHSKADIEEILGAKIYEDGEIIAIDKPAGIAVQGGTGIAKHVDELINAARPEYDGSLRLVHRIDKDTSGVLVIAKGYDAALKTTSLFKERRVKKTYLALVYGNLEKKEGTIDAPIADKDDKSEDKAKRAVTEYRTLDEAHGLISLVELNPLTGRKHQLREHMAGIGHPVVGDFRHGMGDSFTRLKDALGMPVPRRLMLHAHKIAIEGKPEISAPVPAHMKRICEYLNLGK